MTTAARRLTLAAATVALLAPHAAACGSMGNWGGGELLGIIGLFLFVPLVVLVPAELAILYFLGGLKSETGTAYAACLLAKVTAITAVGMWAPHQSSLSIYIDEGIYSAAHFIASLVILGFFFAGRCRRPLATAAAVSTVIPWSYAASLALIGHLL